MTSICNYTHPELQLTGGLERQPTGTLFPYNPEFYERASGLYGPGSILTWHFLTVSVILNWCYAAKDDEGYPGPSMSADLVAMVAYPVFAATDLLVQAIKFIGVKHRALAIFCIRNTNAYLQGFGEFPQTQLNLAEIPPGIVDLGQRAVEITGPLVVCYVFADISVLFLILMTVPLLTDKVPLRPTKAVKRLLLGGWAYVSLLLAVFHFSLGNIFVSFIIAMYEAVMPVALAFTIAWTLLCGLVFLFGLGECVLGLIRHDKHQLREGSKSIVSSLLVGSCSAVLILAVSTTTKAVYFPDLAVTIDERDQLAALIAGIATLVYTVYRVICQRNASDQEAEACNDVEGRQGLVEETGAAEQATADS
ncbi:hypothetical protein VTH82DRAFT_1717 [Thermothelomyces myriococcoides]